MRSSSEHPTFTPSGLRPVLVGAACVLALLWGKPSRAEDAPAPDTPAADTRGTAGADLDAELREIRLLAREKRYTLALDGLRVVARRIQDERIRELAPAFPPPSSGWTASEPHGPPAETGLFDRRVLAQRSYLRDGGGARVDAQIDLHSPEAPASALARNALFLADDPHAKLVQIGAQEALLRFFRDTGEGELRLLVGRDVLVTLTGQGLASGEQLADLARRFDLPLLRSMAAQ